MFKWLSEHGGTYHPDTGTTIHIDPELDRVKVTVIEEEKIVYCCTTQFIYKVPLTDNHDVSYSARSHVERIICWIKDEC